MTSLAKSPDDAGGRREASGDKPRAIAPHAGRRLFLTYAVIGAFATGAGAFGLAVLSGFVITIIGVLEVVVGLWCLGQGVYGLAAGGAVQAVNTSLNLIGQGRLREAEALLDSVSGSRVRNVQRAALVQRALITMRRGAVEDAIAACDAAIQVPLGLGNRLHAAAQRTNAHAIRAVLRASHGDHEGARADVDEVRRDPIAPPQSAARASLAEALLLEKSGDRAALGALLRRDRRLLLDATDPRERTIVRGLSRLLRAPATSVYRKPAEPPKPAQGSDEPALADWVLAVAPEVAPFVRADESRPASSTKEDESRALATPPTDAARATIKADRERAVKQAMRGARARSLPWLGVLVAVIVLAVLAVNNGVTSLHAPPAGAGYDPSDPFGIFGVGLAALLFLATGRLALRIRRARRETRELTRIATQLLRGDHEGATAALEPLAKSPALLTSAQADLFRATIAERRADYASSLAYCDAALGRLSRYAARVISADLLYPEIVATRAAALAALGRADEAAAEIASLPAAYPFLARARFRAQLISLARRGDFEAAAKVAASAPLDLPIGPRDELLRDVVRATVSPEAAGSAEIERLRDELREAPDHRTWLDVVAPGLVEHFEKATTADAHAHEAEAEAEALAEAEAEAPRHALTA